MSVKAPTFFIWVQNRSRHPFIEMTSSMIQTASPQEAKSEVKLLRTLLRLSLGDPRNGTNSSQPTEAELRFYMRCCLGVLEVWGGSHSSEWAAPLWDHLAKHLDSSFLLPGAGLEGLACVR